MTGLDVDISFDRAGLRIECRHHFEAKGITALFGRSGAGKSSLLRAIAGLDRDAQGTIALNGVAWQSGGAFLSPHLRGVGYVFQDVRLFEHLTVQGNLAYALKRAPRTDKTLKLEDVAEALGVTDFLDKRPDNLSGGQKQRVAIARVLLSGAELLLMDEPLSALDMRAKAQILPLIADLPRKFGIPVIYVTHALEEVVRIADHMVVMSDGKLIAAGTVADCLENDKVIEATGRFEAGSLFEGVVKSIDPRLQLTQVQIGEHAFEVPGVTHDPGEIIQLRIRARDVSLSTVPPKGISIRNVIKGTVELLQVEDTTAFAEAFVDIGCGRLRVRVTRASIEDLNITEGAEVFALIKSVSFDRRALKKS